MARYLFAVLVRHTATVDTIDIHLAQPMRPLLCRGTVDSYHFGAARTGAWDPDYDPSLDPRNWRPCSTCGGDTRLGASHCTACAAALQANRDPGTAMAHNIHEPAPHPGDIVPLGRLLDPRWRYPNGRTPNAWVDLAGIVWLGTNDTALTSTGQTPPQLRKVFTDLQMGCRNPDPAAPGGQHGRFDPARWAVAIVDAHH